MRLFAATVAVTVALASLPAHAATLTVDATADLGPVNRDVYGTDFEFISADVPTTESLVAGTPIVRFPGGDDTSTFLWSDPSTGTCSTPRFDWDSFARLAVRQRLGVMLETNVVRGSPESAAQWVADARQRGLRVAWVGIGNEVWGSWDAGYRTSARYADDVHAYAAAIHQVAPDARIVLEIGTFNEETWNRDAIHRTADVIDAVDYHYYPNHQSAPDPLAVAANADGIAPLLARLRAMIREEAPARADAIQILIGEWDGASDPPHGTLIPGHAYVQWSMANALFYGSALGEMLENGVAAAMFYELQGYRFGVVNGDACTPSSDVIRPKALVMQLYRDHFGDRLLSARVDGADTFVSPGPTNWDGYGGPAPYLRAYASTAEQGRSLRLMVVNRHPDQTLALDVVLQGFVPGAVANTWQLSGDSIVATNENVGGPPDAVHIQTGTLAWSGPPYHFSAPPHSITAIEIPRAAESVTAPTGVAPVAPRPIARASSRPTVSTANARGCASSRSGFGAMWLAAAAMVAARVASRRRR